MNRGGFVYIMALLVVLVVAGIAMLLAGGGGQRLRAGSGTAARESARIAALGVLRAVVNDLNTAMAAGSLPALRTVNPAGETVGDCTVLLIGRDPAATTTVFGLIPEAGLIDVNHAPATLLASLPGCDASIAAAIVDWRDADDTPGENGAERGDGTYTGAAVAYAPRNAPIETLEELRLVRGVTDALWFGEDANANGRLDAGEDADGDGRLDAGLRDMCSLENREPTRTAPDGNARIRVQGIGNRDIARLAAALGAERSAAITTELQQRQPFANRLDLIAALDLEDGEAATLWPYLRGPDLAATANPELRLGLIDAASAREDVLVAALGKDAAARVVAARPAGTAAQDPAWLAEALGRDLARTAGMVLTIGSYRFRADILAVRNDGSGWARLDVDIDCSDSGGTARVASIRPAEAQGWPLPWATPAQLRSAAPRDVAAFLATGQP